MTMPSSLDSLLQRRVRLSNQIGALGDLRAGSITATQGQCGKPNCHCHKPDDPGHDANLRLTYKVKGKSITESLPTPAAVHKAEREIAEFRHLQALHKEFVQVNSEICRLRPTEPEALPDQEKKSSKPSNKKQPAK
jgi:hypothetical protein